MQKSDFAENMRYATACKDESGKIRPMNFFVYRTYDDFMIVRMTDKSSMLNKLKYDDVQRIVKSNEVENNKSFTLPDAVLDPKTWANRDSMTTYSSAPSLGK